MRLMVSYLYIVGIGKVFLLFCDITYVTWMTSALCMRYTVPFSILGWIDIIIYSNSSTLFFKDDVILLTSFPRWHQNCNSQAFLYGTVEASGCSILLSNITVPTHYLCCNIDLCFLYGQVVFTAMLPIIHSNFIFSKNSIVLVSTLIQIYQFDQESGSVIYCDRASIIEILRMLHNYKCSLVLFLFSKFYFS